MFQVTDDFVAVNGGFESYRKSEFRGFFVDMSTLESNYVTVKGRVKGRGTFLFGKFSWSPYASCEEKEKQQANAKEFVSILCKVIGGSEPLRLDSKSLGY